MKIGTSRVFRVAIAGSLLIHAFVAAVVRHEPVKAASEPPPGHIQIIHLITPKPTPTPQPPKPHLRAQQTRANAQPRRLAVHTVHVHAHPDAHATPDIVASIAPGTPQPHDVTGTPGPTVSALPPSAQPSPTPRPACSAPDVEAKALQAVAPEAPPDAAGIQAHVQVRVDLDAQGNVTGATVYASSGNGELDSAAVRAARFSRYAPEEHDCRNVPGSYLFDVDFRE